MTEQKLGKWEAIILVVAIVINHIILGLPRSIVAEHVSASILNVIYISAIVLILIFFISKLLEHFPGLDIIDISEFLGGKILKIGISILGIKFHIPLPDVNRLDSSVLLAERPLVRVMEGKKAARAAPILASAAFS